MKPGGIYVATVHHTTLSNPHDIVVSTSVVAIVKGYQLGGVYTSGSFARDIRRGRWLAIEDCHADFVRAGRVPWLLRMSMWAIGDLVPYPALLDRSLDQAWDWLCRRRVEGWERAVGLVAIMEQTREPEVSTPEARVPFGGVAAW